MVAIGYLDRSGTSAQSSRLHHDSLDQRNYIIIFNQMQVCVAHIKSKTT